MGIAVASSCIRPDGITDSSLRQTFYPIFINSSSVQKQVLPPVGIHSIQLYRDIPVNAPVIEVNSDQTLTLKFDELGFDIRTFRVRFTHHNSDWSPSSLIPNFYLQGFMEDRITDSRASKVQRPSYIHYTYEFPNNNLDFLISGNYMIEILEKGRDFVFPTIFCPRKYRHFGNRN